MVTAHKEQAKTATGQVIQVVGVVVDVEFAQGSLPAINNALTVKLNGKTLMLEVAQHLSETAVRTVALSTTDGLKRGDDAHDTGAPITVPVGDATSGRMFNVVGEPIDGIEGGSFTEYALIHKQPPALEAQAGSVEVLETGIKVIDLICPVLKGGKVGLFGGRVVALYYILRILLVDHVFMGAVRSDNPVCLQLRSSSINFISGTRKRILVVRILKRINVSFAAHYFIASTPPLISANSCVIAA